MIFRQFLRQKIANNKFHRVKDNLKVQFYNIFHREGLDYCLCLLNSVSITNETCMKVNFEGMKVNINLEPHLLDDPLKTQQSFSTFASPFNDPSAWCGLKA